MTMHAITLVHDLWRSAGWRILWIGIPQRNQHLTIFPRGSKDAQPLPHMGCPPRRDRPLIQEKVVKVHWPTSWTTSRECECVKARVEACWQISRHLGSVPGSAFSVILARHLAIYVYNKASGSTRTDPLEVEYWLCNSCTPKGCELDRSMWDTMHGLWADGSHGLPSHSLPNVKVRAIWGP